MPRKLSLKRDQREALLQGLVTSLVLHESITTTEAKAKEAAPVFERLVTKAKQGTLHGQRLVRKQLTSENAIQKLFQELAPAFAERNGGYTRIIKLGNRRGDNAPMAALQLVLPVKPAAPVATEKADPKAEAKPKAPAKRAPKAKTEVAS